MLPVHGDMLSCFFSTKNTWGPDCKGVNYIFLAEYADDLSKWGEKLQPYEACFSSLGQGNTLDESLDVAYGQ